METETKTQDAAEQADTERAPLGTCELSSDPHEEGEHAEGYGDEPGDCQPCPNWQEVEREREKAAEDHALGASDHAFEAAGDR